MFFAMLTSEPSALTQARQLPVDEGLFPRIGNGDAAAFEELYRLTERAIYTYALSVLRTPQDALDVTQETYLKIRSCAHLYRPQGKPLAWMFTIAKNLSLSLLRRENRQAETRESELALLEDATDRIVLKAALQTLSPNERQAVLLHVVSGLKHREIAQNLGMPLGTVLACYQRGLKKLRKTLKEGGDGHEK